MPGSSPLVSVVIPAYNAERTIRATLTSVLDQTMADLEVIVVDDGSTDSTPETAASLRDPRVRVLRQPNAGHASARNTGIAEAAGTYIAAVDADDIWLPTKLDTQLAVFREHPHVTALHGAAVHVDDSLRPIFIGRCPNGKNKLLDILCFRGLPGFMCTLMIERSVMEEIGGFDSSLIILQDWELAIRLARRGQLYSTPEPLVLYRVHAGNQSKRMELHIEPGERILANVFSDPTLPPEVMGLRRYVYAHFYAMLCGGAVGLRRFGYAGFWARRAIACDPRVLGYLSALPLRRIQKRLSRRRAAKVIQISRSAGSQGSRDVNFSPRRTPRNT
jgi:glycosyltransferase involved in cell wall biosynthesis